MIDNSFNKDLYHIEGEAIELRLIDTYEGEDGALPFYWWNIILKSNNAAIGKISFRIGHNYHSYYNGNIGYEIDEEYRGNHYALLACLLVLKVAQYHKMEKIYLSCDYNNVASYKTIEKLGANLVEEVLPPKDYIFYDEKMEKQRIYELKIDCWMKSEMKNSLSIVMSIVLNTEKLQLVYRDFGKRPIALGCYKDNTQAERFYLRHGFKKTNVMEENDYYYLHFAD